MVTQISGAADQSATRSLCCRPRVRGATPIATKDTTSITPIVVRAAGHHAPSKARIIWRVTSTIAEISQSSRSMIAVLRYGAGSASTLTSRVEPGQPLGLELLGPGPGERRQRRVGAGEAAGQHHEGAGRDQRGQAAHRVAAGDRQSASSRSCRPNISSYSSGSAWS